MQSRFHMSRVVGFLQINDTILIEKMAKNYSSKVQPFRLENFRRCLNWNGDSDWRLIQIYFFLNSILLGIVFTSLIMALTCRRQSNSIMEIMFARICILEATKFTDIAPKTDFTNVSKSANRKVYFPPFENEWQTEWRAIELEPQACKYIDLQYSDTLKQTLVQCGQTSQLKVQDCNDRVNIGLLVVCIAIGL